MTDERIENLERQVRRLRWGVLALGAALAVAVSLGAETGGCVPFLVDFRRSLRADELNSIVDQPIRSVPPCNA